MSNTNLSLGERMKRYESVSKSYLMRRQPVIIRLDGVAFHTFTRGLEKPFDDNLIEAMQATMLGLCEKVQGCVIGYTQSDEISLVLCDYQKLDTDAWFGYGVQKLASVSASMATLIFNKTLTSISQELHVSSDILEETVNGMPLEQYYDNVRRAAHNGAMFDARAFTLPIEEVNNYLLWRQRDATRNSIQSLAQTLYSHRELEGISSKRLQDKMFTEKGVNWNDLDDCKKRGSCCIYENGKWIIANHIPVFSQFPDYVNSRIVFEYQR